MAEEEPKSPILISEIHLQNLLSFGPDAKPIPLGPLNVLIGANGSGKSNLIEAISLLKAMPNDLSGFINDHGGIDEWIWKVQPNVADNDLHFAAEEGLAKLHVKLSLEDGRYYYDSMEMRAKGAAFEIVEENFGDGKDFLFIRTTLFEKRLYPRPLKFRGPKQMYVAAIHIDQSILVQAKDPQVFPELAEIGQSYSNIRVFGKFQFGRDSKIRQISEKHRKGIYMEEDFSNLNAFLLRLFEDSEVKEKYLKTLQSLFEGILDIEIQPIGDFFSLRLKEGIHWFPAHRLSDGTIRYLCLIAILLDPTPPPLICIEEPELGMHPDLINRITTLLIEASERTQLIITTHSNIIVDGLSERPEAILVCEKENGKSQIERLDPEKMAPWLENYRLGDLWMRGGIGGTRW